MFMFCACLCLISHILQIKNLEDAIEKKSKYLNADTARKRTSAKRASAEADIEQLKRELESIYAPYR